MSRPQSVLIREMFLGMFTSSGLGRSNIGSWYTWMNSAVPTNIKTQRFGMRVNQGNVMNSDWIDAANKMRPIPTTANAPRPAIHSM